MNFEGRRLKRYLLLRKQKIDFVGGIELILPNKFVGWIIAKESQIDEIRFYLGKSIIAKTSCNILREDVSEKYNIKKNVGFEIILPEIIPYEIKDFEPKIIAISYLDNKSFELNSLNNSFNFSF